MTLYGGNDPAHCADTQTQITTGGLLVKYHASGIKLTEAVGDAPIGWTLDEGSRDSASALEAAGTQTCSIMPLDGIGWLVCEALASGGKFGMPVYAAATDGYVALADAGSATVIGHYFGNDAVIAAGELIPVSFA